MKVNRRKALQLGLSAAAVFPWSPVVVQADPESSLKKNYFDKLAEYKSNYDKYRPVLDKAQSTGLELMDYHVHVMKGGKMTSDSVAEYQKYTGLKIGMVENAGKAWLLSDNKKIAQYLDEAEKAAYKANPAKKAFQIGIQINDRDWYSAISPENLARLDYVLADTLVMMCPDGSPYPLWNLPADCAVDPEVWMKYYFAHCMAVLDEPLTIWADPFYLPSFCRNQFAKLWTEDRVEALIAKAIRNQIAIEIQGASPFPILPFIKSALKKGAKIVMGSNNFDDNPKPLDSWITILSSVSVKSSQLLALE